LAGGILAHQHHRQPRGEIVVGLEADYLRGDAGAQAGGELLAINDGGGSHGLPRGH